ncbi:Phosphoenolpyruvate synthase (modular protein) [Desulfovibrionales bacterium]
MPLHNFLKIFSGDRYLKKNSFEKTIFQTKYSHLKSILAGNNHALELITEIEQMCYGTAPFTRDAVINLAERLVWEVYNIAEDLSALSQNRYPDLPDVVERIGVSVLKELISPKRLEYSDLTIPLDQLSMKRLNEVGGKAANLREVYNHIHLPVPIGFAVTAYACQHFLKNDGLVKRIDRQLKGLDVDDTAALLAICKKIQTMITATVLPKNLAASLTTKATILTDGIGSNCWLAVRSIAIAEDSESSFAGQYSSVLGISPEELSVAYKKVVASTFTPRAVYYHLKHSYTHKDATMCVLVLAMVNAKASGTIYTRDPNDLQHNLFLMNSVRGLGVKAMDGSATADFFLAWTKPI